MHFWMVSQDGWVSQQKKKKKMLLQVKLKIFWELSIYIKENPKSILQYHDIFKV